MRLMTLPAALAIAAIGPAPAFAQSAQPRWLPVVLSASAGLGGRSVADGGEGHIVPGTALGAGFRVHDLAGVIYEFRRSPSVDPDRFEFRLVTLELYPAYRTGNRAFRVGASYGRSRIRASPFVGGHRSRTVEGEPSAWGISFAFDKKIDVFAISPFWTMSRTTGGLNAHSCSTSFDAFGFSTTTCSDAKASPVVITIFGLALSLR